MGEEAGGEADEDEGRGMRTTVQRVRRFLSSSSWMNIYKPSIE